MSKDMIRVKSPEDVPSGLHYAVIKLVTINILVLENGQNDRDKS